MITQRGLAPAVAAVLAGLLGIAGCQIGPQAIELGHADYASAVGKVLDEQLLLNLVRMRYRATPVWLEIASISTQFEVSASGSISGEIRENVGNQGQMNPGTLGLGAGTGISERPTITYSILGGEDFIKRLLAPIPVTSLALVTGSGWRSDRVLRLTVERINGVKNAPRASGPTPKQAPDFKAFREAVTLMFQLSREGLIDFAIDTRREQISDPIASDKVAGDMLIDAAAVGAEFFRVGDGSRMALSSEEQVLILRVAERASQAPEVQRLRSLLYLQPDRLRYDLVETSEAQYDPLSPGAALDDIAVQPRSMMGVMYYLSNAVRAPREHVENGPVTQTLDADGSPFDWGELLAGTFTVHHSKQRPRQAAVTVPYRGYWFYIADDDESSLSTFALLNLLNRLTSGELARTAPVLTLPVGG